MRRFVSPPNAIYNPDQWRARHLAESGYPGAGKPSAKHQAEIDAAQAAVYERNLHDPDIQAARRAALQRDIEWADMCGQTDHAARLRERLSDLAPL